MLRTLRHIVRSALLVETSQFEGIAALRCTIGVALVLVAGLLLGQPLISAFGAVGALSVGFGSFQGAYRSRAAVMVAAAAGMALSVFVGSIAGSSDVATVLTATTAGLVSGLLVGLGPAASFVGLQCAVAALIAGGFPAPIPGAAVRALIVFGGGLVQTLLVVMIWPLRRFSAERRALAIAYRSLARYAAGLAHDSAVAPEPHTFATTPSPLDDPQPFARAGDVLVFQSLLDEGERIRASLASLAAGRGRMLDREAACAARFPERIGHVLNEIADALEGGRAPREVTPLWAPLDACVLQLPRPNVADALLGQLRAAWRMAGAMTSPADDPVTPTQLPPLRRLPPVRDALSTLRANLTLRSTVFRHALRVAVTLLIASGINRGFQLSRGYWIPMTAVLVLRPEFQDTFLRGGARIVGTILGAGIATLIVNVYTPGPIALMLLVLVFGWGCYALFRMNYALFTISLTGYVVFILMLSGVAEMTAAMARATYTLAGGLLALVIYAVWPTWAASTARPELASVLAAQGAYVAELLGAYGEPRRLDFARLAHMRSDGRLARSNAEAVVERMIAEPARRASIAPRAAVGLLAAVRRNALGALALQAGLERGVAEPVDGLEPLAREIDVSLAAIIEALTSGEAPAPLPPLRQTQLALPPAAKAIVGTETDLLVDSINTMAELLVWDAAQRRGR